MTARTITIPVPQVAPLGWEIDKPVYVQDLWETFVQPDLDTGVPPSVEMRALMAVLRAVHAGLSGDPMPDGAE